MRRVLVLAVLAMAACSSVPIPPPQAGESLAQVAVEQGTAPRRPDFSLLDEPHRLVLYGVDEHGVLDASGRTGGAMFVFEDDVFLCRLHQNLAIRYSSCLAQQGGRRILADRLRALCAGKPDPLAESGRDVAIALGDEICPSGIEERPPQAAAAPQKSTLTDALVGSAVLSAGIILLPVLLPAAAIGAGGNALANKPSLAAQEKLELAMTGPEVAALMGRSTETFTLEPVQTEVRYYERGMAAPLWIGLRDDRVIWLRFGQRGDDWLAKTTERVRQEQKAAKGHESDD